jgi:hypothetical protein
MLPGRFCWRAVRWKSSQTARRDALSLPAVSIFHIGCAQIHPHFAGRIFFAIGAVECEHQRPALDSSRSSVAAFSCHKAACMPMFSRTVSRPKQLP